MMCSLMCLLVLGVDPGAEIDAKAAAFLKDKPHVGLVIGVSGPKGRVVRGHGKVTLDGKAQVPDGQTLYEIGSITKAFTGTLLADRVLAGEVALDAPVRGRLPKSWRLPARDGREITFLHLATHTSSLPVQPPLIGLLALKGKDPLDPYGSFEPVNLERTLTGLTISRPIGSKYEYSNLGVGLLGHALAGEDERGNVRGRYEALLIERVLRPLHLDQTRITLDDARRKRLAPGHNAAGKPTSGWTFACLEACGGLRSNADDLLTFAESAMGSREVPPPLKDAFRLATEPWREIPQRERFVGLCWMRQPLFAAARSGPAPRLMIWHNGGTGGYRSFLGFVPETKTAVVALANTSQSVDALAIEVLQGLQSGRK